MAILRESITFVHVNSPKHPTTVAFELIFGTDVKHSVSFWSHREEGERQMKRGQSVSMGLRPAWSPVVESTPEKQASGRVCISGTSDSSMNAEVIHCAVEQRGGVRGHIPQQSSHGADSYGKR